MIRRTFVKYEYIIIYTNSSRQEENLATTTVNS